MNLLRHLFFDAFIQNVGPIRIVEYYTPIVPDLTIDLGATTRVDSRHLSTCCLNAQNPLATLFGSKDIGKFENEGSLRIKLGCNHGQERFSESNQLPTPPSTDL